jgi:hypothetical protein
MMSYLQLGIVINVTEYQSAVVRLVREKAQVYFSGNPQDWVAITTEIENIAAKYNVPIHTVADDVSTEYKESVKRTIEYASRIDTKFKG